MYCKTKRWTAVLVACLLLLFAASAAQAQDSGGRRRGFMLEFGIGTGYITYGDTADANLAYIQGGGDRINLTLDLALGGALSQNIYLVGVAEAFATRIFDSYGNYLQENSYLFGLGLRIYPFHTGLQLGLDAGYAMMNEDQGGVGYFDYPSGWGVAASIGWDVSRRATGFSAILGIKANYNSIDYAPVLTEAFAVTAFVDLIIK